MQIFKIILILILVVIADFVLWRKWREEYPDEEIFTFSLLVGLLAGIGGILGSAAEGGKLTWGISGWAVVTLVYLGVGWWSRLKHWNWWETMDTVVPVAAWMWAFLSLTGKGSDAPIRMIFAWLGLAIVGIVKRNYRRWHWYRSGKMGLVSLTFLGWFSIAEITVAFLSSGGIYWGGLKVGQLISAYLLAFAIVGIYLRSERKLKEDFRWFTLKKKIQKSTQ